MRMNETNSNKYNGVKKLKGLVSGCSVLAVAAGLVDKVVQESIHLAIVVVLLADVGCPQMAGVVMDFQQDSFLCYFFAVPIVDPCQLPVSPDEFGQLLHWAPVVVLPAHHVNERVWLFLNVVVRGN